MEKHSVSVLGSTTGIRRLRRRRSTIRGYPPPPLLSRAPRRSGKGAPGCVQHSLQVLDDGGLLIPRENRRFRNTVIVMTSNIGSEHILDVSGDDSKYEVMRLRVLEALRSHLPGILNRVDDIILFHTLSRSELRQIIIIQIKRVQSFSRPKITAIASRPRLLGGCGL